MGTVLEPAAIQQDADLGTGLRPEDLTTIARRASTLHERLACATPLHAADASLIDARLEQWCRTVAAGDWTAFAKRLAWDGIDPDHVRAYLVPEFTLDDASALPGWTSTLHAIVQHLHDTGPRREGHTRRFLDADAPAPFEDLFALMVEWAANRCWAGLGELADLLSPSAQARLERSLLWALGYRFAPVLHLEFRVFRATRQSSLDRLLTRAEHPGGDRFYREFIAWLLGGAIRECFREYSFAARQIATTIDLWIDAVQEFVTRLARDRTAIAMAFNAAEPLGRVEALDVNLSDPHNGNRTVMALTFAGGLRIVYKPRSVDLEEAFFGLLAWLNRHHFPLPLKALTVLAHDGYGWIECVAHTPCRDRDDVRRFFQRSGELLCLVYAMQGNDCHSGNVIAAGDHPVLVDLETLFHALPRDRAGERDLQHTWHPADEKAWNSVLRTSFLPHWDIGRDGRGLDTGGMSSLEAPTTPGWHGINTDEMAFGAVPAGRPRRWNLPVLDGRPIDPGECVEAIVTGFRQAYEFLVAHRPALIADAEALPRFSALPSRFIFRSTDIYGTLDARLTHPDFQRLGIDYSIQLKSLGRAFMHRPARPIDWPMLRAEHDAIVRSDIPVFTATGDGTALHVDGAVIDGFFEDASYDRAIVQLQQFSHDDLDTQSAYIRASFRARAAASAQTRPTGAVLVHPRPERGLPPSVLIAHAIAIAERLQRSAVRAADGSASWIALEYDPDVERFRLKPLGDALYSGNTGIALFLAATERTAPRQGFGALALDVVRRLRQELKGNDLRTLRHLPIGGMVGIGSIVYAFTRMGVFLEDESLLRDAASAARLVTDGRIAADRRLDIVGGAAGAALGLLAAYNRINDFELLERAVACGDHLLANRTVSAFGPRAWATVGHAQLGGFSHGASGIAYALLQLSAATGEPRFREAAVEGLSYEQCLFSSTARNWQDLRSGAVATGEPQYSTYWCHGAPGIGLARVASLSLLPRAAMETDITVAMETTLAAGPDTFDHLCCGTCGRADILLEAGRKLQRPDLIETAERWVASVVERSDRDGWYRFMASPPPGNLAPSLFQGSAGVGYELLRMASGEGECPCVLVLE